jgi:hypothetical protein
MITHHAAAAASCAGTWSQRWNCARNQPVSPAVAHAGYDFGHSLLPALFVLLLVLLLVRSVKKRKKSRSPATAGAGGRR